MSFEIIETNTVDGLLHDAQAAFDGYREALSDRIKLLKAEEKIEKTADISRQLQDLNKLMGIAVDLTRKVEDARAQEHGGRDGGGLDLDAARVEIRGRLARLRAARSAGSASVGDVTG